MFGPPREKHRIDFLGLLTRKERNPWLDRFYFVLGVLFFGYLFYVTFFGDGRTP